MYHQRRKNQLKFKRYRSPFTTRNPEESYDSGQLDDIVPIEYVCQFVKIASKLGDDAKLIPVPDVGHFEIVMATHPAGQLLIDTILGEFV